MRAGSNYQVRLFGRGWAAPRCATLTTIATLVSLTGVFMVHVRRRSLLCGGSDRRRLGDRR